VRILPSFLVIGAQRAGTTSLFVYLSQHPHVAGPTSGDGTVSWPKELHFFDKRFSLGLDWYRTFFPLVPARQLARLRGRDLVAGEATPSYLFHPEAPERVAACLPEVRLIAILRNPIERAYSHYQKRRRMGREHLSFQRAVESEERPGRKPDRRRSYLARGLYAEQLERWLAYFPREKLLVLRSEDLMADPAGVYAKVVDFLALERWQPESFVLRNRASYAPIDPALRARLEERFTEPNLRLARLLGRDFGWTRAAATDVAPSEVTTTSGAVQLGARRQA
jgi:Sulfotransferase domain